MKRRARLGDHPHAVSPRGLYPFVAVLLLLALSAGPAFAGYSWCSRDPVLTLQRNGALTVYAIDIQVQVALGDSVVQEPASLTIKVPANVTAHVVDASTPIFPLDIEVRHVLDATETDAYGVQLKAHLPASYGPVPVQLVITDPTSGLPVTCGGQAGQSVQAHVAFAPFAVAC